MSERSPDAARGSSARRRRSVTRLTSLAAAAAALAACAYEIGYRPDYVPEDAPGYVAAGKLIVVMPREQQEFVYEAPPQSRTGDFTTLTVPLGAVVRDIAAQVFGQCFQYGVEFVETREGQSDYVLAIEGDLNDFIYRYSRVIDVGFNGERADVWTVPEVAISFHVRAFNQAGRLLLDKVYDSGVQAGESYLVTSKPAERINRALHATLHALMLQLAADVKPLLMQECNVTDVAAAPQ